MYDQRGSGPAPGWLADPTGRHQARYWNGVAWTEYVLAGQAQGVDPLPAAPPQYGAPAESAAASQYAPQPQYGAQGYGAAAAAAGRGRRTAGTLIGAIGGALMIAAVFLDWLGARGWVSLTGWKLYDVRNSIGQNAWIVGEMFDGFSPFWTGLPALILGIALTLVALIALVVPGSKTSGRFSVTPAFGLLCAIVAVVATIPGVWNMVCWAIAGRDTPADPRVGLYLLLIGSILGAVGLLIGITRSRGV